MNHVPTYLGEVSLDKETLEHFGIKGMKWGRRKLKEAIGDLKTKYVKRKAKRLQSQSYNRRRARYVASHIAKDEVDGRRVRYADRFSNLSAQNIYEYGGRARTYTHRNSGPLGGTRSAEDSYNPATGKSTYTHRVSVDLKDLNKARKAEKRRKKK